MPELKRNFTKGRMNKDLDERLVPNGEYRDAMNVEVSSSEGSDVGSVQNVLGNTVQSTKDNIPLSTWSSNYISNLTNEQCIGSVCDYENNKIYWFITSDEADCIAEYDEATKVVTPILVDKSNVLNFSNDYKITGVNIITGDRKDGYIANDVLLFWTDNKSEPKQINITKFKEDYPTVDGSGNLSFNHNTQINGVNVKEPDITVIKKSPLNAPTLTMSATKRTGNLVGTGNNPAFCSFNFSTNVGLGALKHDTNALLASITTNSSDATTSVNGVGVDSSGSAAGTGLNLNVTVANGAVTAVKVVAANDGENYKSGEVIKILKGSIGGSTDVEITLQPEDFFGNETHELYQPGDQLTFDFNPMPNFREGDVIIFSGSREVDTITEKFDVRVKVVELLNEAQQIIGEILSISSKVPKLPSDTVYEVTLDEGDPLFELKFPRFAYRWKYKDGQYSCFSPFSEIAFLPGVFDYASTNGHNKSMVNTLKTLTISGFQSQPNDVDEVDILYKESDNTLIYVVDTLKDNETSFALEEELFKGLVEENQLMRHFDAVPKKAKAQEVVGSRIVYGNYVQNYMMDKNNYPDIRISAKQLPYNPSQSFVGDGSTKTFTLVTGNFATLPDQVEDIRIFIDEEETTENFSYASPVVTFETAPADNSVVRIVNDKLNQPQKSIKTLRTYQAGVTYMDKYGRTSPVFTNPEATEYLELSKSEGVNSFELALANSPPDWATHYKYYIKEGSSEYYNLILDRFYVAEDGNLWLSFPSSDRDKIQKGDFIILKKEHDTSLSVTSNNKFKTLDVKNSAPEFIKNRKLAIASSVVKTRSNGADKPNVGAVSFQFVGPGEGEHENFTNGFTGDNFIVIKHGSNTSKFYRVENGGVTGEDDQTGVSNSVYRVTIAEPLSEIDGFLDNIDANSETFTVDIYTNRIENTNEFPGRFYAKVARNNVLDTHIIEKTINERLYDVVNSTEMVVDAPSPYKIDTTNTSWTDMSVAGAFDWWENHPTFGAHDMTLLITGSAKFYPDSDAAVSELDKAIKKDGTTLIQFEDANGNKGNVYRLSNVRKHVTWRLNPRGTVLEFGTYAPILRKHISFDLYDIDTEEPYIDKFEYSNTADHPRITKIYILKQTFDNVDILASENPAVFETEPKKIADLDLYHEISDNIGIIKVGMNVTGANISGTPTVTNVTQGRLNFSANQSLTEGDVLTFTDSITGITATALVDGTTSNIPFVKIKAGGHYGAVASNWFNCYSYGNGVESNRIRDDFNAPFIDKGPKVSTVLDVPYLEEHRKNGLTYSGIYNSTSGVNRLNQFIAGEKITKDLNPEYGSIQRLHTRDTDLTVLCEDKVLKVLANKDALFNADGNINLTSTNNVLGQAVPYLGDYGISKNPESFSHYGYRSYFTDKARGAVLRLSRDGLESISRYGMKDWFKDNLKSTTSILGSYNEAKGEYNVTLSGATDYTVSFDEQTNGWVSFKSYIPESGISINNMYYTFKNGLLYSHDNATRNTFYGESLVASSVKFLINESPSAIKGFKTINYEGSQAKQYLYNVANVGNVTYKQLLEIPSTPYTQSQINALSKSTINGWYVNSISTDTQTGIVDEFDKKENKWFNTIKGDETIFDNDSTANNNVDTSEFPVQGIGRIKTDGLTGDTSQTGFNVNITVDGLPGKNMTLTSVSGPGTWMLKDGVITRANVTTLDSIEPVVLTFTCNEGYENPSSQTLASQNPTSFNVITYNETTTTTNTLSLSFASGTLSADKNITVTLNNAASVITANKSIAGTYNYNVINTSTPNSDLIIPVNTAYNNTGAKATTEVVITRTITAKSGYAFGRLVDGEFVEDTPTAIITRQNDTTGKYTISYANRVENSSRLTSIDVKISYTYGEKSTTTNDYIVFFARGRALHTAPADKVKGYFWSSINEKNVHAPDNSPVPISGGVRYLNVWGEAGAAYGVTCSTATVFMDGSLNNITSKTLNAKTDLNRIRVDFPAATSTTTHTFTLTGSDLDNSIAGGNPFTLKQNANVTLTLSPHSIRYANANEVTVYEDDNLNGTFNTVANTADNITRIFPAYGNPTIGKKFNKIPFKYVFDDSSTVNTIRTVTEDDFSNLNIQGYTISVEDLTQSTNSTALTITGTYYVLKYGNVDNASLLAQSNFEGTGSSQVIYLTITSGTNITFSQVDSGKQLIVGHADYQSGDVISGTGTIVIDCPGYSASDVTLSYDSLTNVANNSSDTNPTFSGTGTSTTSATFNWSFTLGANVAAGTAFSFRVNASF